MVAGRSERLVRQRNYRPKITLLVVLVGLGVGFVVARERKNYNVAATLEWAVGYIFYLFISSFSLDLPSSSELQPVA
jgi:hypothetical protein